VARVGSILWLSLQDGEPPRRYEDISESAPAIFAKLHQGLLNRGVYLAPSAYEVTFVSTAHDDAVIDRTIAAFDEVIGEMG
jgi:glutamate-1-semialdehyde 2,1-aminomutase